MKMFTNFFCKIGMVGPRAASRTVLMYPMREDEFENIV
jgi:hypothetical protein